MNIYIIISILVVSITALILGLVLSKKPKEKSPKSNHRLPNPPSKPNEPTEKSPSKPPSKPAEKPLIINHTELTGLVFKDDTIISTGNGKSGYTNDKELLWIYTYEPKLTVEMCDSFCSKNPDCGIWQFKETIEDSKRYRNCDLYRSSCDNLVMKYGDHNYGDMRCTPDFWERNNPTKISFGGPCIKKLNETWFYKQEDKTDYC